MKPRILPALLLPLLLLGAALTASADMDVAVGRDHAGKETYRLKLGGSMQMWVTLHEEAENGREQPYTNDRAAQEASGFSLRRTRLYLKPSLFGGVLQAKLEVRFEETPGLMDAWAAWNPLKGKVELWAGQMKVVSTYEVEEATRALDFPTRSLLSQNIVNWSLVRNPALNTTFRGVKTFLRDTGLALKGNLWGFRYFLMMGNGLGANLYVGGDEHVEYISANAFGAYFYGIRASFDSEELLKVPAAVFPVRSVRVGGHLCWNNHHDAVLLDQRTVVDLVRFSWSADVRVNVIDRIRFTAMMGGGRISDDVNHAGINDLDYAGWELKGVVVIVDDWFEVGFRAETYEEERAESGIVETTYAYTVGCTFTAKPWVRIQLAYKWKEFDSPVDPDLDDNVFLLTGQLSF